MLKRKSQKRLGASIKAVTVIAFVGFLLMARNGLADPSHLDWNNPWKPTDPYPKFITANFVKITDLEMISRFRSGAGHNYSDEYEAPDRSMKHYLVPLLRYRGAQGQSTALGSILLLPAR